MGASDFYQHIEGADVRTAFNQAHQEAQYEYGHGGYTGSLAEKHNYIIISSLPVALDDARRTAQQLISDNDPRISDKWGPAGAIAVHNALTTATRRVELTATLPYQAINGRSLYDELTDVLAPHIPARTLKAGETLLAAENARVTDVTYKAPIITTGEGPADTRYLVTGPGSQHATFETGLPTQAAARAYAKTLAAAPVTVSFGGWIHPQDINPEWAITATTRRATGAPLVTATRQSSKITLAYTAIIAEKPTPRPANTNTPTGWLFFGLASS